MESVIYLSKVILVSWSIRYPGGRVSLSSHVLLMTCLTCKPIGKKLDIFATGMLVERFNCETAVSFRLHIGNHYGHD